MNYLAEIKAFYDLIQVKSVSTGQIALWHGLMAINNKCAWIEWFTVSNRSLELNTGLSRSGILKARNSLKQNGFIDFKVNGTKATIYKMYTIANSKQDSVQDSTQNSNTLNKLNETKLNDNLYLSLFKKYKERIRAIKYWSEKIILINQLRNEESYLSLTNEQQDQLYEELMSL